MGQFMNNKIDQKQPNHKIVAEITFERTNIIELLIIAIIIAFGVNFITDAITNFTKFEPLYELIIGVVLCLVSISYFLIRFIGYRQQTRKINAFFIYDKKKNSIVGVPRYDFGEKIKRYLEYAFNENKAFELAWSKEPLNKLCESNSINDEKQDNLYSKLFIYELIEYYILDNLSDHLRGYFNNDEFSEMRISKFLRNDIPEVLLSNRFLELFSKPMEDRPVFIENIFDDNNDNENITHNSNGSGVMYSRFELILPTKSSIQRPEPHTIEIRTGRIKMLLKIIFEGYGAFLPDSFEELYLGIEKPLSYLDVSAVSVSVNIDVEMKFGALFTSKGWEYYYWIDSFLETLNKDLSADEFFSRINWESAYTVHMIQQSQKSKDNSPQ
jgi:hypothetical protein